MLKFQRLEKRQRDFDAVNSQFVDSVRLRKEHGDSQMDGRKREAGPIFLLPKAPARCGRVVARQAQRPLDGEGLL